MYFLIERKKKKKKKYFFKIILMYIFDNAYDNHRIENLSIVIEESRLFNYWIPSYNEASTFTVHDTYYISYYYYYIWRNLNFC